MRVANLLFGLACFGADVSIPGTHEKLLQTHQGHRFRLPSNQPPSLTPPATLNPLYARSYVLLDSASEMHVRRTTFLRLDNANTVKMLLPIVPDFSEPTNQNIRDETIPDRLELSHRQVCLSGESTKECVTHTASINDPLDIDGKPLLPL
jgi:hypothetical protein